MTRRRPRALQCEIERAMSAVEARRARGGENWRVRLEPDGAIVIEQQPAPEPRPWAPEEPARSGEASEIVL